MIEIIVNDLLKSCDNSDKNIFKAIINVYYLKISVHI